jgi:opacity protein-like surface antigen
VPRAAAALVALALALGPSAAWADDPTRPLPLGPPPSSVDFLQYGAAYVAESQLSVGSICTKQVEPPCIFGSGGGLAIRAGYRDHSGWYLGGAYEVSKHTSGNLLTLPTLQQLRAEGRWAFVLGQRFSPYASVGAGLAAYGDEWAVATYGPVATLGAGIEFELAPQVFVGVAPSYRAVSLQRWRDGGWQSPLGLSHFFSFEITLEARRPLPRY